MSKGSIQARLSRWLALQTLIGLSLACLGIYAAMSWSISVKHEDEFRQHYEMVRHAINDAGQEAPLEEVQHKLKDVFASHPDLAVELRVGDRLAYSSRPDSPPPSRWLWREVPAGEILVQGAPVATRLALDVGRDDVMQQRLGWTLVGTAALGSALVSLTGFLLVRRSLQPLHRLAIETASVGPDKPGRRIEAGSYAEELQPWIEQFNALLQRAESAYAQLEAFNADLAHELRTPLSNMIAQVEVELGRSRSEEALREALGSCLEEVRRMSTIMTDMLFLSQADRGVKARRGAAFSLAQQVEAVAEFHEAALEERNVSLSIEGDSLMAADAGLLRRAISNLVSNAIRHAPAETEVVVVIDQRSDGACITVQNHGNTVPADVLGRMFERFFRADAARTGSSQHHGLGLAIVAAIARMHDGRTYASSHDGMTKVGLFIAQESLG